MSSQQTALDVGAPWLARGRDEALLVPEQAGWSATQEGRKALTGTGRCRVKRFIDVLGAASGLIMLAPLLALIALVIRIDSRGPILFRQQRLGLGGVPFRMTKFRTMVPDAEERLKELEHLNESAGGVLFKLKRD